ncbi:UDP-2,4-diacetamido-2,4,6-trideoxy-beta-L-altropyranose hydrolase [Salinibacter ruber]|uniref:UDP-2,4-diacetamido-2,4, 6-trideoxy-beta-L-altropyranose hydrolase n=1 Tax=Salinibacter ruber TaxID=146919 RepID=UPI0021D45D18|nr:UDP-2,4-diacetamido-2,4,6-trideoxy-beta-L-altropyranose hydrolase [Salinibacter ruber]
MLDNPLLIRADASKEIGTGHVMRCLALAQSWKKRGGDAAMVHAVRNRSIKQRLNSEGVGSRSIDAKRGSDKDAQHTLQQARRIGADWIVLDGYVFDEGYQQQIAESERGLLVVDDEANHNRYSGDFLLNQNLHANEEDYSSRVSAATKLLTGPQYALLRKEFWTWKDWERDIPDVAKSLLVMIGGSDPDNITSEVLSSLAELDVPNMEIYAVIGGSNSHEASIREVAESLRFDVHLFEDVQNIPELMARADLAVSAGGSTIWELAFMQVPTLGIARAEQEIHLLEAADERGIAKNLGGSQDLSTSELRGGIEKMALDTEYRVSMMEQGRNTVDGNGAHRVAQLMYQTDKTNGLGQ